MSIVGDLFAVVFLEQLRVHFLLRGFELLAEVILLANKDELARRGMIFVFEEIMHPEPEIVQVELAKVLAGAKPGEIPVEQPAKFELVINQNTAKTLGLELPLALLIRADDLLD